MFDEPLFSDALGRLCDHAMGSVKLKCFGCYLQGSSSVGEGLGGQVTGYAACINMDTLGSFLA